jgi:hypothetical protein
MQLCIRNKGPQIAALCFESIDCGLPLVRLGNSEPLKYLAARLDAFRLRPAPAQLAQDGIDLEYGFVDEHAQMRSRIGVVEHRNPVRHPRPRGSRSAYGRSGTH